MTTPQDLAAQIEALAAKAKPGDWKNYRCFGTAQGAPNEICVSGNYASGAVGSAIRAEDAELICLLRNNLPAIVAAIRQGEGAGDRISREETASAIERTAIADSASASDMLVFLAAAIRDDRVTPTVSPVPDERDRWPADAKFHMGDLVQKKQRSKWRGPICGFYSTSQTPIGYVVESQYETGSVQAWPEAALIGWDGAPDERDDEVRKLKAQVEAGRLFLNAANAAWAAGEPSHRVKTMLDRADQFRAALSPAEGGEA